MSETKKSASDVLTMLAVIFGTIGAFLGGVMLKGALRKSTWTKTAKVSWGFYLVWLVLIVYAPKFNVPVILDTFGSNILPEGLGLWIGKHISRGAQFFILFVLPFSIWLFFEGILDWIQLKKYQNAIDHLGLKTPTGLTAKVIKVLEGENNQKKILVLAMGLDVASFRDKKGVLESSLNAIVHDVRVTKTNRQMFEIIIAEKELPTLIRFDEVADKLSKPYTFLVGESADGFMVGDLRELHHMLIAGATGGGKSVFFKQALIGLLKSSKHIQLYLIDLKRGVDVKPFEALENVEIAKETFTAISTLTQVVAEMERRFKHLEAKGFVEIDSERDGLDRIIVAIDEASVLFTVEKSSKETKEQAQTARELTDKIAKLGRAAGIHLILATQKVVKETIDTRVQTNINAKMCFRVNTVASSMTVLGNKKASELPDVKGRGIWSVGSNDITVQVPKLDNQEVIEEIDILTQKFNGGANPLKQSMLQIVAPVHRRKKGLENIEEALTQLDAVEEV